MGITVYTTYADVRAALGVDSEELEDSTLALELYASGLEEDLYDVSASLVQTYQGIKEKDEAVRTGQESRAYNLTRLFATYSVAKQLGAALPMFSPRTISDGKASVTRFSGEPYKDVLEGVEEKYDLYRGRLVRALEELTASVSPVIERTQIRVVTPAYDPVTGA